MDRYDYNPNKAPLWRPEQRPPAKNFRFTGKGVCLMVAGVLFGGFVCASCGVYIVDWLSRFEVRVKDVPHSPDFAMRSGFEPQHRYAGMHNRRFDMNRLQPGEHPDDFYFMKGRAEPYPVQSYPDYRQPGFIAGVNPEIDQFLIWKRQQEYQKYMEHLRRQVDVPMPDTFPPRQNERYPDAGRQGPVIHDNYAAAIPDAYPPRQNERPPDAGRQDPVIHGGYAASPRGIRVPENILSLLKQSFSRDLEAVEWLRKEKDAKGVFAFPSSGVGPETAGILGKLAETTFNGEQYAGNGQKYARTALVYAEMAERGIGLSVSETLRWAKAAELARDYDAAAAILELAIANDRTNIPALREIAGIQMERQRFPEAADAYAKLMELEPGERAWRTNHAAAVVHSGDGAKALDLLNELHREDPKDRKTAAMLAELLMKERMYEPALPVLDSLIAGAPNELSVFGAKLAALQNTRRFAEAAELVDRMVKINPGDIRLLLDLARASAASGQEDKAVKPFEQYLALKPGETEVRLELADAFAASGNYSKAAAQYRIVFDADPQNRETLKKLANAHMTAREFAQAADAYSILIAYLPENRDAAYGYVNSLRMSKRTDQALISASKYILAFPDFIDMIVQGAEIAAERGNFTLAAKWFRHALQLAPNDYRTRLELARNLLSTRRYGEAETELNQTLVQRPGNFDSLRLLARTYFHQNRYNEALASYGRLQPDDPTGGAVAAECAYFTAIAGDMPEEAAKQLATLRRLEPKDATWRYERRRF